MFRLWRRRVARHASQGVFQPPGYRQSGRRFAAKSHRAPGAIGARAFGDSARPAIDCTRGQDRNGNRRPAVESNRLAGALLRGVSVESVESDKWKRPSCDATLSAWLKFERAGSAELSRQDTNIGSPPGWL